MFNPIDVGVDYVELMNIGTKVVDLSELYLANVEAGVTDNYKFITTETFLVFPNEIVLISTNTNKVKDDIISILK